MAVVRGIKGRKGKKKQKDLQGIVLIVFGFALIVAFGFLYFEVKSNFVERDKETLCQVNGVVAKETVIVVDSTDIFSETQSIYIAKRIRKLLLESKVNERFTLYVLGEDVGNFKPLMTACNPGTGEDKSELTAAKRKLLKQFEDGFIERMNDAVVALLTSEKATSSPIVDMLKFVSVNTMIDSNALEKRIVVVSDMIHHSSKFSHYRGDIAFSQLKGSGNYLQIKPYLQGTDIQIYYVNRPSERKIQNLGHVKFWEDLVNDAGGRITRVEPVN